MFEFDETKKCLNIINVYLKEEKIIIDDLTNVFDNIIYYYNTNNSFKLNELIFEIRESIKKIDKNLYSNVDIIEKNIESYQKSKLEANKKVVNILDDTNIRTIN